MEKREEIELSSDEGEDLFAQAFGGEITAFNTKHRMVANVFCEFMRSHLSKKTTPHSVSDFTDDMWAELREYQADSDAIYKISDKYHRMNAWQYAVELNLSLEWF